MPRVLAGDVVLPGGFTDREMILDPLVLLDFALEISADL
jgi:hypothetical protein